MYETKIFIESTIVALPLTFCGLPKCRIAETSVLSRNFLAAFWQTAVMRSGGLLTTNLIR